MTQLPIPWGTQKETDLCTECGYPLVNQYATQADFGQCVAVYDSNSRSTGPNCFRSK
jgi:hypothetical protein